ncbi:MAG TPA: FAD-dependent oxidoreductase, partial [Demequina sp.]|nr:FAD-dependent oxidoreductase [Demequina sp.]
MTSTSHGFVIVGASLAGAKAAETLRKEGFAGRVTLIGDELHRPYERPPLSKGYLLGSAERESVFVHPATWYAEHDVDLRLGTRATAVDARGHEVHLADGDPLRYAALLLATGSEPVRLTIPGADLEGGLQRLAVLQPSQVA